MTSGVNLLTLSDEENGHAHCADATWVPWDPSQPLMSDASYGHRSHADDLEGDGVAYPPPLEGSLSHLTHTTDPAYGASMFAPPQSNEGDAPSHLSVHSHHRPDSTATPNFLHGHSNPHAHNNRGDAIHLDTHEEHPSRRMEEYEHEPDPDHESGSKEWILEQ